MAIKHVETIGVCRDRHTNIKGKFVLCEQSLVRVTFSNGAQTVVHDDGSFVEYLGESNAG